MRPPEAAKAARQQGHGSVLVAPLIALGVRMRLKLLLVSATAESHGFWLRQGLHTPAYCSPAVRAMLRLLLCLAAAQGEAMAQCNLGSLYYTGHGGPVDYAEARRLFGLAAEQGRAEAQYNHSDKPYDTQ